MYKFLRRFAYLSFISWMAVACSVEEVSPTNSATRDSHLALGNPSEADKAYANYLVEKPQYALSYNSYRGTPNWVSWHLSSAWLGEAPRQDDFRADQTLPSAFYKVVPSDYTNSGFDRGHNTPSADRTGSVEDNSATFLMTNMIPQAPNNNQKNWAGLENYCRELVEQGNELYIIMGSYGKGGEGSNGYKETLAGGKVTVPNRIWKVIVVLPLGSGDVNRINTGTRVIAVDTPNANSVGTNWSSYRTTVDVIEAKTGYDLLSNVPDDMQDVLEAKKDDGPTQ
ncbi:DNA/RNA non-specific endonuclease [Pontibacter ruber]|uniref:DNA/RNA non-specific endonuclease n=1 Tax=Pontibacter ruber TaxID=1343895 RepID=A0ABW5CQG1_9BACT|nr:DNA/RNA non-specific endonuclease [Pontibacter ruber]